MIRRPRRRFIAIALGVLVLAAIVLVVLGGREPAGRAVPALPAAADGNADSHRHEYGQGYEARQGRAAGRTGSSNPRSEESSP